MSGARAVLSYLAVGACIYLAWKLCALYVAPQVLPEPFEAVRAFLAALLTAEFWGHFAASAWRVLLAMALAFGAAFPLGVAMGASRRVDRMVSPFVVLTYPVPKIVLLPVFLLLLGLGDAAKVAMIALILAYQILVTTRDGVRGVHPKHVDSVRSLGASKLSLFTQVYVPAGLPHGFTALRLGTGVSVAVLFFVESFATAQGLGFLIMDSWGAFDFTAMFTGILGMSALGVALYETVNLLERRLCAWRGQGGK